METGEKVLIAGFILASDGPLAVARWVLLWPDSFPTYWRILFWNCMEKMDWSKRTITGATILFRQARFETKVSPHRILWRRGW